MALRFLRPVLILGFAFLYFIARAQDRCGTVEYTRNLKNAENRKQFEDWLTRKSSTQRTSRDQREKAGPYTVPIVVHVIHNGESIGTGTNISDEQILSQIKVLNDDFNRLNADAVNTPPEFEAVAGVMDIEFILAKQDPEGLPTNGIVRVDGNRASWTSNDNYELKSKSYWPSENYLNVWVCNITDYLGYTQFPVSPLAGLENSSTNAATDGIVISHLTCGSIDDGPFDLEPDYNKGRTLTHEMGHFFGLLHIWGDDSGGCQGDDYVDDTPNQAGSTTFCATHPVDDSCSNSPKMFQNFLDYTDDECMNLFTQAQVNRMSIVIESSPRRASLLTSPGSQEPVPVPNDLGARVVVSPLPTSCSNTITPTLEVRNYGSNAASSVQIRLTINELEVETKDFTLNDLAYLEAGEVTFSPAVLTPGTSTLTFQILLTNGVTDSKTNNNSLSASIFVPETVTVPFVENLDAFPYQWTVQNPDQQTTWQIAAAPKESQSNTALSVNFYDYEDAFGEIDVFLSPVFSLADVTAATVYFDVAYTQFEGSNDGLRVIAMKGCEDISNGTTVFEKTGVNLSTTAATSGSFVPSSESQWRNEFVNLTEFIGEAYVQLAFVAINDWGNNLYIDNIAVVTSEIEDLVLKGLQNPGPVTCNATAQPVIVVQNAGNITINQFNIEYSVNGGATQNLSISGTDLEETSALAYTLPEVSLQSGVNVISVKLAEPNGIEDTTPENNEKQFIVIVNDFADRIPLRENFDQPYDDRWISINPTDISIDATSWQSIGTTYGTSVYFNIFDNNNTGDETWMVSPVLDFTNATTASMVFDLSYATRMDRPDRLRILASVDCGYSYSEIEEIDLSVFTEAASPWIPVIVTDWRNMLVDLEAFSGQEQVRIAFVATNAIGNNLFLDNIEFFVTPDPTAVTVTEEYSIYGYHETSLRQSDLKITFNLDERQDVAFDIVDTMGKQHANGLLTDVLNQTFPLDPDQSLSSGIYIVRLRMRGRYYTNKILITR